MKQADRAIALLALATAVVVTIEFIVIGLLPVMARDLGVSLAGAGRLASWFALSAAVLGPPLTIATSRLAPHRVLAAALVVFGAGNALAAAFPAFPVLAIVRVAEGAALPVFVSVGSAAVAHVAPPDRAGRALALVNVGVVVGIVVGVPAGVLLAGDSGWRSCFALLGVLAGLCAAAVRSSFPRLDGSGLPSMRDQVGILERPGFHAHLLLSAALFTAMFAAYTYLVAFLEAVAGYDSARVAIALTGFGAAGLAGNWIAGRVVDRAPTASTAGAALALALATAAASLAGGRQLFLIPDLALWGAAHAAAFTLCHVRVMKAGASAVAFAASLNIAACNLGISLGAAAGGWLVVRFGIDDIGLGSAVLAAGAFLIAMAMLARSAHRAASRRPA